MAFTLSIDFLVFVTSCPQKNVFRAVIVKFRSRNQLLTLKPLMECFPNPLDVFHISIWERARRECLKRQGTFKVHLKSKTYIFTHFDHILDHVVFSFEQ